MLETDGLVVLIAWVVFGALLVVLAWFLTHPAGKSSEKPSGESGGSRASGERSAGARHRRAGR